MLRFLLSILILCAIIFGIYNFFIPALTSIAGNKIETEFQDRLALALESSGVTIPEDMFSSNTGSEVSENQEDGQSSNNTDGTSQNGANESNTGGFGDWRADTNSGNSNSDTPATSSSEEWKNALSTGSINNLGSEGSKPLSDRIQELEKGAKGYFGTPPIPGRGMRAASGQEGGLIFDPALVLRFPYGKPPFYFGNTQIITDFGNTNVCMYLIDDCGDRYSI